MSRLSLANARFSSIFSLVYRFPCENESFCSAELFFPSSKAPLPALIFARSEVLPLFPIRKQRISFFFPNAGYGARLRTPYGTVE